MSFLAHTFDSIPSLIQRILLLLVFLVTKTLCAQDGLARNVYAALTIQDSAMACEIARQGLELDPHSKPLWESYIKALAKSGEEVQMLRAWKEYVKLYPQDVHRREVLESMAWGVIDKGAKSHSPVIRIFALLAAFFSQDAKGVELLARGCRDCNSYLRGVAVQLAGQMRDAKLQDEIARIFRTEKVHEVKIQAIRAIGTMRIKKLAGDLEALLSNETVSAEEKACAIQALVNLFEKADRTKIERLAKSSRAGLRLLAAEIVMILEQSDYLDLVVQLLEDPRAEVRAQALETIGFLRAKDLNGYPVSQFIAPKLKDQSRQVAMMAAWVTILNHPTDGQKALNVWLNNDNREVRLQAALLLNRSGKYGIPLIQQAFKQASDPYVKMNLAIGLIGQRLDTQAACDVLYQGLIEQKEKWMWNEEGMGRFLAPSNLKPNDAIPNYPEAVNQQVRLEILNMLAILKYPKAQEAIKQFLQERSWGITGMASALLLSEGDDSAIILVKNLLKDTNPKVRIQAALILALWEADEEIISVLQDAYLNSDREMKERILEGIGRIGSASSISFLVEAMHEPFQTLRLIAASSLLQCLYH